MLDQGMRTAVLELRGKGHTIRQIARVLEISRNSVREVIASGSARPPETKRRRALEEWHAAIRELFVECRGNVVRVREELAKRRGVKASYSSLTRYCRDFGLRNEEKAPTYRIETAPAEEMQHDTSSYVIEIGGRKVRRHCASLVLGYSRRLFIQFYPRFDRFHCKVFLTEAFRYNGGSCKRCVIDNSSIVIACGAGSRAQVAPEMEAFERRFAFRFWAHEVGDANRSGKVERRFWLVECNFLPGRRFKSDADLNAQALAWLEETANARRLRELGASAKELFAAEAPRLTPLPIHVPEPYRDWRRAVDLYGYVHMHGMSYSAPRECLGRVLTVRETHGEVILMDGPREAARHRKLTEADGKRQSTLPGHERRPHRRTPAAPPEEATLKAMGPAMQAYLEALKRERGPRYYHALRRLYALLCQHTAADLLRAVAWAAEHRVFDAARVERMLLQTAAQEEYLLPLSPQDYEASPEYHKGAVTPPSDMSAYEGEEGQAGEDKEEDDDA